MQIDNNGNPIPLKLKYPPGNVNNYVLKGAMAGGGALYNYLRGYFGKKVTYPRGHGKVIAKYRRYRKKYRKYKRVHPKTELKAYWAKMGVINDFNLIVPKIDNTQDSSTLGYYGNQLFYFFTPNGGYQSNEIIGKKCVVKSIHVKITLGMGTVATDYQAVKSSNRAQLPVNVRVVILRCKDYNHSASTLQLSDFFSASAGPSLTWVTPNKTQLLYRYQKGGSYNISNYKVLFDQTLEFDGGYLTDSVDVKIKGGFTCTFKENPVDDGQGSNCYSNALIMLLLPDLHNTDVSGVLPGVGSHDSSTGNWSSTGGYPSFKAVSCVKYYDA